MKPVSFERACSIDAENHNDRRFCWWMHFADGFKVGRRTARARQLAAGNAARARHRRQCVTIALLNAGIAHGGMYLKQINKYNRSQLPQAMRVH